jgi:hypothetical protein
MGLFYLRDGKFLVEKVEREEIVELLVKEAMEVNMDIFHSLFLRQRKKPFK